MSGASASGRRVGKACRPSDPASRDRLVREASCVFEVAVSRRSSFTILSFSHSLKYEEREEEEEEKLRQVSFGWAKESKVGLVRSTGIGVGTGERSNYKLIIGPLVCSRVEGEEVDLEMVSACEEEPLEVEGKTEVEVLVPFVLIEKEKKGLRS